MKYKDIEIKWLGHDGFILSNSKKIFIDPYKIQESGDKADILLITHTHPDHASIEDMKKIYKSGTKIIGPIGLLSMTRVLGDVDFTMLEPGKEIESDGIKISAVPAYNTNKQFHPKDEGWMGYLVEIDGIKIYHAGDTDLINEMKNISCDIALLPVSGKFVMNAYEAANAARIIKSSLFIPMHWGSGIGGLEDAQKFAQLCKENGIRCEIIEREIN